MFYFSSAIFNQPVYFTEVYQYVYTDKEMKTDPIFTIKASKEEDGWTSTLSNNSGEIQTTTHCAATYQSALLSAASYMMFILSKNIEEKVKPELKFHLRKDSIFELIKENCYNSESLCKTLSELFSLLDHNLKGLVIHCPKDPTLNLRATEIYKNNYDSENDLRNMLTADSFSHCDLTLNNDQYVGRVIKTDIDKFVISKLFSIIENEKPFICNY